MPKILVTFPADVQFREAVLNVLDNCGDLVFLSDLPEKQRAAELSSAEVLFSWSPGRELQSSEFKMISRVKLIQLLSAGTDHVPFSQIPSGVEIAGNAGAYAEPMAEHVLAMILAIFKNLPDRHNKLVNGTFDHTHENRMLRGSACAILGFGGIGRATARLLQCFDVRILAINSSGRTDERTEFIGTLKDLEHVLRLADIILVSLPLTNTTRGLIGSRELSWMKNDATVINVARGEIVDEAALYEKLRLNASFNAAIDAWWAEPFRSGQFRTSYPFLTLPNVLGSPHNSALVPNSVIAGATYAAENVKRFLNHEPIVGLVQRSDYT
jgi:glycerate dehydrogenase